jgi:penicillin V acylase-like amidase (Ntn superfamily)
MKKHLSSIMLVIICICLLPIPCLPCTTFVLDNNGQPVYGKNADWSHIPGFVIVNKRGVAKTPMPLPKEPSAKQISWTSKFGSVTFNFEGRELPFEGLNEAGLFISSMGLFADTEYPQPDSRPAVNGLQWVQYQLDNFSTVAEVIASDKNMRIQGDNSMGGHYLVSDPSGRCASIECIKGEFVCHTGWTMPAKVLANSPYDQSIVYYRQQRFTNFFLPIPIPDDNRPSLDRFAVAADRVKRYRPLWSGPAVDYAFQILQNVEINPGNHSALWSAVYDSANKRIYFRSWNNDRVRWFDISSFDFSCTVPVKVLDTSADLSGDVSNSFVDYTKEIDIEMLKSWGFSQGAIEYLSSYPDTTVCTE